MGLDVLARRYGGPEDGKLVFDADLEKAARWFEICSEKGYGTVAWY